MHRHHVLPPEQDEPVRDEVPLMMRFLSTRQTFPAHARKFLVLFGCIMALFGVIGAADDISAAAKRVRPTRIIIGLDLSQSNPLVRDETFAAKMALRVHDMILPLKPRSEIKIRSFGVYSSEANKLSVDQVISVRAMPETVAQGVKTLIASLPRLVREGRLKAQPYTNILSFMDNMGHAVDCDTMPTHFVLLTDGVEDSEYARLGKKGETLPPPTRALSGDGCTSLLILGLGQGLGSPAETERLRVIWAEWAKGAGFAAFDALNDW
jgi:hypothetical protein